MTEIRTKVTRTEAKTLTVSRIDTPERRTGFAAIPPSHRPKPRVRGGLSLVFASLLVIVPAFALGGRLAWGQLVIVLLIGAWSASCLVSAIRGGSIGLDWSWCHLLWLAAAALVVVQVVPLPTGVLDRLSPHTAEILPVWTEPDDNHPSAQFGAWKTISLAPGYTIDGAVLFACLTAVWLLAVQQFRSVEQVRAIFGAMFAGAVLLAAFGLIQWLFWNGRFYWSFDVPGVPADRQLHGPFTNRNHFAGFLALAVGPACYWVMELIHDRSAYAARYTTETESRRTGRSGVSWELRLFSAVAGLAMIMAVAILTLSRGGALVSMLTLGLAGAGLAAIRPESRRQAALLGCVCLAIVGGLSLVGQRALSERFGTLVANTSTASQPGRLQLWSALCCAAADFPVFGTGFGSHRYVYPLYMTPPSDRVFTHAENCYLQLWVEGGLVAINLLVAAILGVGYWIVNAVRLGTPQVRSLAIATSASLLAAAVHATVDFVWYVPAYAIVVTMLAAVAFRLSRLCDPSPASNTRGFGIALPRAMGWLCTAGILLFAGFAIPHFVRKSSAEFAWHDYLRHLHATERRPERDDPAERAARIQFLERTVATRPGHAEAHFKLAQILASPVNDVTEIESGSNRSEAEHHCRLAVQHCPLIGEAYLLLAKLAPDTSAAKDGSIGLITQAVRVRPHDAELCFASGFECFRRQQPEAGLAVWRQAATSSSDWERRIVRQVAPHADPNTLVQHLDPTPHALVDAAEHCGSLGQPASKQARMYQLARSKLEEKPTDLTTSDDRFLLHSICKRLGDTAAADQAMDRFVAARGRDFGSVLEQARWYHETGRDDRAVGLLERCRAERPNDVAIKRLMREIAESSTWPDARPEQASAGTRR